MGRLTTRCFLPLLVVGGLAAPGCSDTYCDANGLTLAIWNLPPEPAGYTFRIEFEDQAIELACASEPSRPGSCETTAGPWQVDVVVYPDLPPTNSEGLVYASAYVVIRRGDQHSSYVPRGDVRVRLTSAKSEFEHVFSADVDSPSSDCELASADWDVESSD